MGTGLIDFLCEECGCFFRIPFPFSPFLFADCGFPYKDILYYLSLGLFTILHGKSTPIYGLFHPLLDILRLDFLLCVLVRNIIIQFFLLSCFLLQFYYIISYGEELAQRLGCHEVAAKDMNLMPGLLKK